MIAGRDFLRIVTLCTLENAMGLEACFISNTQVYIRPAYKSVSAPENALLVSRLTSVLEAFALRENQILCDLPGMCAVVQRFIPMALHESVYTAAKSYIAVNDVLNIEGFVRFRLQALCESLDEIILRVLAGRMAVIITDSEQNEP